MSLVVVLVGLVGYSRLSVREYPNIDPPVVTVTTTYQGASAPIVETQVTKVLEDSLSGIEGIDYLTSISREEQSQITIRFKLERDPDDAAADVRDRVSRSSISPSTATGIRPLKSPTTPTATSRTSCRRCPAWRKSRCSASANIRCASGSIRSGSPPTT
jgi:multidrug efflux pump subunit AcrB